MTALAYAILFPDEVDALVTISGAARATPFAIAIRSVQREAIRSDPEWKGGDYEPPGPGDRPAPRAQARASSPTARRPSGAQRFGRERVDVRDGGERPLRRRVRDRGLPGDARAQVRGHLRRQLLPLPLALDGPVRRGGARRLGGGGAGPHPGAARRWSSAWRPTSCSRSTSRRRSPPCCTRAGPRRALRAACPRSRATTRSWSTYDRFGPAVGYVPGGMPLRAGPRDAAAGSARAAPRRGEREGGRAEGQPKFGSGCGRCCPSCGRWCARAAGCSRSASC